MLQFPSKCHNYPPNVRITPQMSGLPPNVRITPKCQDYPPNVMITLQMSQLPSKFHDYTPYVTITLLMSRLHSKYHIIYPIKLQNISVDQSYYLNIFFMMYFGADKLMEGRKMRFIYIDCIV